jgi:hypothetical protein
VILIALFVAPQQATAAPCGGSGAVTSIGKGWTRIAAPEWPTPALPREVPLPITTTLPGDGFTLAVDPANADHILFSNTHTVMLSLDAGCTWQAIFKLDPSPSFPRINGASDDVSSIAIQGDYIYIHVFHRIASTAGTGASVFYSHDLGKSFALATSGFPPPNAWYTWPSSMGVSAKDPRIVYLALESYVSPVSVNVQGQPTSVGANLDSIYASTDGGVTWAERSLPTGRSSSVLENISARIAVDGRDASVLWAYAPNGPPYRSDDGGNTWGFVGTLFPDPVNGTKKIDTIDAGTFTAVLGVPATPRGPGIDGAFLLRSDDGGQSFYKIPTGSLPPENAIFAGAPNKIVMRGYDLASNFYVMLRLDSRSNAWVDISPPGAETFGGEVASRLGTKPVVFTFNEEAVYRYTRRL